jgi:hypothetical protein
MHHEKVQGGAPPRGRGGAGRGGVGWGISGQGGEDQGRLGRIRAGRTGRPAPDGGRPFFFGCTAKSGITMVIAEKRDYNGRF